MHTFQQFGLSYYEGKALDILLKEQHTPKTLARKAGIPPGKVYSVISSLLAKNLISETETRPKKLFVVDPSATVAKLIAKKEQQDTALISELRSIATDAARHQAKPSRFFEVGTTLEDNKTIQLRTFTEAATEVCQIINIHHKPHSNRGAKTVWEQEIAKAIKRGVRFRAIYPISAVLPPILARLPRDKFVVRRLNTDFTRCDIIDGKKTLLKLVHDDAVQYGGVIFLENEPFAKNLQQIFEHLWEQAE